MTRSIWVLAALTAGVLPAQLPPEKDPVLRAMRDEIARTRELRIVDAPPYFVEYSIDDGEYYFVRASFGAILAERPSRVRQPRVRIRVGDMKLDNSNHVASDFYRGSRFDPQQFPVDDHYDALRISLWLATDRAYKTALEALARKKSSLKNVTSADNLPDFSAAPAVKILLPHQRKSIDAAPWRNRARSISNTFSAYPVLHSSEATANVSYSTSYVVNSEGTELRYPDNLAYIRARASALAPDGMTVRDWMDVLALEPGQLPADAELQKDATRVAENVTALANAPAGDSYSGPVLFEGASSAQLFAQLLGRNLSIRRRPVSDPERPINWPTEELEGKIGSRILPEWMEALDDPTQQNWNGKPLFGYYPVDVEGVVPKAFPVVEKGVLKTYYMTRQPQTGIAESNGHARLPGPFGVNVPLPGNLLLKATGETAPQEELRKRLLAMIKQRNKPFAIVIRKLDFPSTGAMDELRRIYQGQGMDRVVSAPLLVYRVYPDGKEELVRGLRFRGLNTRSLRDIQAASTEQFAFHYLENGSLLARADSSGYVCGVSVVAPAVLIDDVELEKVPNEWPKPPIVPAPPLTASR